MSWEPSVDVVEKAQRYLAEHRVKKDSAPGVYWVKGSSQHAYRVQTDADPIARTATTASCTCKHAASTAAIPRCSHVVAVLLAVRDGVPLAVLV